MPLESLAFPGIRREDRDEVHHRARAVHQDGRMLHLLVVNLSSHGFMARCDAAVADDDVMRITLPGLGRVEASVRWALGGRMGCQFDRPIALDRYRDVLAAMLR